MGLGGVVFKGINNEVEDGSEEGVAVVGEAIHEWSVECGEKGVGETMIGILYMIKYVLVIWNNILIGMQFID